MSNKPFLNFIGSGSAFNTKLGNNSAFFISGDTLVLIDCGEDVFKRVLELDLLNNIKDIKVIVTHCHSDHVGSLASFILYSYYSHGEFAKKKIEIISHQDTLVENVLRLNGCVSGVHHNIKNAITNEISIWVDEDIYIKLYKQHHVEELNSFGIQLMLGHKYNTVQNVKKIWYSGDSSDISENTLGKIYDDFYDEIYIDTCGLDYEGNVHLSLSKLEMLIMPELRHKVWCMHLDETFDKDLAIKLGFNVVENYHKGGD